MPVEVASRDLRNHTADLLRRVEAGEEIVITVRGKPVARLEPVQWQRQRPMPKNEVISILESFQTDPGLRQELRAFPGAMTDEDGLS